MKFSIITVLFNDEVHIKKTMMSVLNQTYLDFEYVVIDGASSDASLDIVKSIAENDHRVRWISEPDLGIYDAMNKGINLARGQFVNFMNSGDFFADDQVLSKVAGELAVNPQVDLLYGSVEVVCGGRTREIKSSPKYKIRNFLPFCHQSVFIKKDILCEYPFSLEYKYASDYDQFVSMSKNNNIIWLQVQDIYSVVSEGGAADHYRVITAKEYIKIARRHFGYAHLSHWLLYFRVVLSQIFILRKALVSMRNIFSK